MQRGVRFSEPEVRQLAQPTEALIARLADHQHGVVSLDQLRGFGLSARVVQKRAAAGRLHRVHRGVYAVGRARLDRRGRWMAAALAAGPGAVISHRTAAAALGIASTESAAIDITIPSRSGRCRRTGVRLHHSPGLAPADITRVEGILCTTVARTLLDLAAVVSAAELARAIEAAERLRIFDGRQMEELLDRAGRHPGAGRLRVALAAYQEPPPTRQEFERRAFEVFARAGLPRPQMNVWLGEHEVDFCWPERRLVVEADSWEFHRTRAAFERDRRRDQQLRAAGWTVVRVTWRQLTRTPDEVTAAIAAA